MPTFSFQARTSGGEVIKGTHDAPTEREAIQALHAQGYWILKLRPLREGARGGVDSSVPLEDQLLGEAPPRDMAQLLRQWAATLNSGISVQRTLELTAIGARGRLGRAVRQASVRARESAPLSEILQPRRLLFGEFAMAMIAAGESSGRLVELLHRAADHFERKWGFRLALRKAMMYPILMFVASILIQAAVAFFLHGLRGLFGSLLPIAAQLLSLFLFLAAFRWAVQTETLGLLWSRFLLVLPVLGKNGRKSAAARFVRTFADLFEAGIRPAQGLEIAARTCGNQSIGRRLLSARSAIHSGMTFSQALQGTGVLPLTAIQMLRTGEESGSLPESLNKAADYLESEVKGATDSWAAAMPILLWAIIAIPLIMQIFGMWGGYMHTVNQYMDSVSK
jgi:type II secretory pathway component PulF